MGCVGVQGLVCGVMGMRIGVGMGWCGCWDGKVKGIFMA